MPEPQASIPTDVPAWTNLAMVRLRQGKREEALQPFERAVQLEPDNVAALTNYGERAFSFFCELSCRVGLNFSCWHIFGRSCTSNFCTTTTTKIFPPQGASSRG